MDPAKIVSPIGEASIQSITLILQILSYLGAAGIGVAITIILKYFFDRDRDKRKMLFEARVKAYADLTGKLANFFDHNMDMNSPQRVAALNKELSLPLLLASKKTAEELIKFQKEVSKLHDLVEEYLKTEDREILVKGSPLRDKLSEMSHSIHDLMRKDIFIK